MDREDADVLTDYLEAIHQRLQYRKWYFGHYHENRGIDKKHILLYDGMTEEGVYMAKLQVSLRGLCSAPGGMPEACDGDGNRNLPRPEQPGLGRAIGKIGYHRF